MKLFGFSKEQRSDTFPWIALTNENLLSEIRDRSNIKYQLVFKHSTRCGISRMVIKGFESKEENRIDSIDFYYLDLLKHRELSNQLALEYNLRHESPQVLLIKNGVLISHASHSDILAFQLKDL